MSKFENGIAWEDPLWDGAGCVTPGDTCCQRHCWSHRQVNQTSKSIKVRWCGDNDKSGEDVISYRQTGDLSAVEYRKYKTSFSAAFDLV